LKGGLRELFYTQIGAVTVSGVIAILLNGRKIIGGIFPLNLVLVQKLLWFGFPFAVTSFFRQVIPAIDRFFLLYFNFDDELPYYILAVKIASFFTIATNAFTLAFMPYSLNKLNEKDAEVEISNMFRLISVLAFATIPFIMLFRNQLILLFADASYLEAAKLLPILFFGWVFDLFGYFSMLGIYKSRNSLLLLVLLLVGTGCISLLNIMLVPLWGIYGAAISFTFTKLFLFVFTILVLKKHFRLHIYLRYFLPSFVIAVLFCFFIFYINTYLYLLLLLIVFICLVFLFRKYLSADNIHKMFTSK
jgi:O-antigen/teichoic acid export membrane protein